MMMAANTSSVGSSILFQHDDEFNFFIIKGFTPSDLCHDGQSQNRTFMQRISRGNVHDLLASCAARCRRRDPQTG